ncbi:hypothetical protein [uncultured Imperialibacter sp.]|uniref:hypothetical protein n=1 Tax=uncultured Imperialibacter sp. TaxID=1672639 RepID=UPI0030D9097F
MRRVLALRTKAATPRRYFICRTYGTRSTALLGFWRYRRAVPNWTGDAIACRSHSSPEPGAPKQDTPVRARTECNIPAMGASPSHQSTITSNLTYRFYRYFLSQNLTPICK